MPTAHQLGDMELVFARAGAMEPLLCDFDWSSSALGDPAGWPQSLRSAASICLGAKYPIAIYWGDELTLLYNEAWSAIPGDKHPWALGRAAREVWPDIWDIVGPDFERALAGEGTWAADRLLPMERRGYLEETYFNYNLSPILAEDGRIEGIFNAGIETTPRLIAARHQRVLIDLIAETASATSVDEAFAGAIQALTSHREVAPFAVLYRLEDGVAQLAGSTGVRAGGEGTGATVALGTGDDPWRIHHAIETRRPVVIDDIGRFADVEAFDGWPETAHTAVTLPVVRSRRKRRRVEGVVVVGMPPGLRIDDQHARVPRRPRRPLRPVGPRRPPGGGGAPHLRDRAPHRHHPPAQPDPGAPRARRRRSRRLLPARDRRAARSAATGTTPSPCPTAASPS